MVEVTWLVVADGGRARVFQMPGLTLDLQAVEELVNDEYTGTMLTEKDREKFAKRVGEYIEKGRLHQRYNRLRLAIEPRFLGMVRADLSEDTRRMIFEQISEDLAGLSAGEIEARLRKQ
ncbi:host attachment protein [Paraburkholderia sp. DHOC27]|nr:host attachment protein [Paraburkholderia sp. DHOC27]